VTQFCHLLYSDDDPPGGGGTNTDCRQDFTPSESTNSQRLQKVLTELLSTEQQYVKVELLCISEFRKTTGL